MYCPSCGQQLPPKALFCSRCGTKIPTPPSEELTSSVKQTPQRSAETGRTLKQDLEDIRKVGFWVALFISLPIISIPALIGKVIDPGLMGGEDALSIWQILQTTAPLTIAVAFGTACIIRGWFKDLPGRTVIGLISLIFLVPFAISAMLGVGAGIHHQELRPVGPSLEWWVVKAVNLLAGLLLLYFELYGWHNFISAFAAGIFLGWAWGAKLLPPPTR